MQIIENKNKTNNTLLDNNKDFINQDKNIILENILKKFNKKLQIKNKKEIINKILPQCKKVFEYFMKDKLEEVILTIIKNTKLDYSIEFKVLPKFYYNDVFLNKLNRQLADNEKAFICIHSLKEFYLENLKTYSSSSGGSTS